MKKLFAFFLAAMFFAASGCSSHARMEENVSEERVISYYDMETQNLSFSEIVQNSNCAAAAVFREFIPYENYVEYRFEITEVLYGDITESEIFLYMLPARVTLENDSAPSFAIGTEYQYEEGQEYLLIMEKRESNFYEHDRYLLFGNLMIPCANPMDGTLYARSLPEYVGEAVRLDTKDHLTADLIQLKSQLPQILSDPEEVQRYVLEVQIEELVVEAATHSGVTYQCTVLSIEEGNADDFSSGENGQIYLTVFPGMVQEGKRYRVEAERKGAESIVYTVVSENSVEELTES